MSIKCGQCSVDHKPGFTILEILVIITILGILSWVVVPQLTEARIDDRESVLIGSLQTLRAQLEVYRVQHLNEYPCGKALHPADPKDFTERLTTKTNADHSFKGVFGPYLKKMPTNLFNGMNNVRYGTNFGAGLAGWCFDPTTGRIAADDGGQTADGTKHENL
jgi:general secretion pathway protein G